MPKIKLTRNVFINGEPFAEGDVTDVIERDATYLVAIGKAVDFDEEAEKAAPAPAAPSDKRPSYEDLKAKGKALGLEFPGNIGSEKLTVLIEEAEKAAQ